MKLIINLCCCLFLFNSSVFSQSLTTVQVVKKTYEEKIGNAVGKSIQVEGEKAEIEINTWEHSEVKVTLQLSAKHPDRKIAERDLEKNVFTISEFDDKIIVSNKIIDGSQNTDATLHAHYNIFVPEDCPVYVSNYFGKAIIKDVSNLLDINARFTSIDLERINGLLNLETTYGKVVGNDLDGNLHLKTKRSDVFLDQVGGLLDVVAEFGSVTIYAKDELTGIDIDGNQTDINLFVNDVESFNFNITNKMGEVELPPIMGFKISHPMQHVSRAVYAPVRETKGIFINLSTSLGTIKVNGETPTRY